MQGDIFYTALWHDIVCALPLSRLTDAQECDNKMKLSSNVPVGISVGKGLIFLQWCTHGAYYYVFDLFT